MNNFLFTVLLAGVNLVLGLADGEDFLCVQGTNSSASPTPCLDSARSCYGPKFTEHIGLASGVDFGCGRCEPGLHFECEECQESGCNQPQDLGETFSCYNYKVAGGAVTRHPALQTCFRSSHAGIICNMPSSSTDYRSTSGCGPCGEQAKLSGSCIECYSDSCNIIQTPKDRFRSQRRAKRSAVDCSAICPYR